MSQTKVFFVFPGDINTRTGGYLYDKLIIEELKKAGWDISLISLEGDYPFPDEAMRQSAARQLAAIPNDSLVIADGLAFSVLPELFQEHESRLRTISLIHHPLALETGLSDEQSAALKKSETEALRYAAHIITTSEHTAETLADFNVSNDRITVVFPGTAQAAVAVGSQSDIFNLICVATINERKGHAVLVKALKHIEHLPWQLSCAGSCDRDPGTYKDLVQLTEKLGLNDRIRYCGELNNEQLEIEYQRADLFVLASYYEGYGMVLDEAIARALPIVATSGGAIADTVPRDAGILTTPGDSEELANALQQFMEKEPIRESLRAGAANARKDLRSWSDAALQFDSVLKQYG